MYELGWTNLVTSSWQGVLVPTGTPRPIIEKLHAAIARVLADPEIQDRMRKGGAIAVSSKSPEDFKAYIDSRNREMGQGDRAERRARGLKLSCDGSSARRDAAPTSDRTGERKSVNVLQRPNQVDA